VSSKISYQGVLKKNDQPVTESMDMTFRFYSNATCSTQVGSDIVKSDVQVTNGLFSVDLDVPHSHFNGQGLWLKVFVDGTGLGCEEILPVPYALSLRPGADIRGSIDGDGVLEAQNESSAFGTGVKGWASADSGRTYGVFGESESTDYGTGVYGTAPKYGVYGWASADSGNTFGVIGESDSTDYGTGVFGTAPKYGVYGYSRSTSGTGVYGYARADSGYTYGVYGQSDSTDYGKGVYGRAPKYGVYGYASADSGYTYGVYGSSRSTDHGTGVYGTAPKYGVYGSASADSGYTYGVYGSSRSTDHGKGVYGTAPKYGVYGYASADSGNTFGVYAQARSPDGTGVYGCSGTTCVWFSGSYGMQGYSSTGYGVYGVSDSTSGRGVYGYATADSGETFGVYGKADSTSGWAGYFEGAVKITGDVDFGGSGISAFPRPAYDSGWVSISPASAVELTHNLGGNPDNYVVDLQFKDDGAYGIHNIYYGGREAGGNNYGANWRKLTNTTIEVFRHANDDLADYIRVRIWVYKPYP
jgi:hypothetical protein